LISYAPEKNKSVIIISTTHHNPAINKDIKKPYIITDYNMTEGIVIVIDQMYAHYSV